MSCLPNWSDAGPRVLLDDEGLNLCAVSWQTLGFLGITDGNGDSELFRLLLRCSGHWMLSFARHSCWIRGPLGNVVG
jgi:hypothetical protein